MALAGIISIGDVVKTRVDELVTEKDQLVDYIRTAARPPTAAVSRRWRRRG